MRITNSLLNRECLVRAWMYCFQAINQDLIRYRQLVLKVTLDEIRYSLDEQFLFLWPWQKAQQYTGVFFPMGRNLVKHDEHMHSVTNRYILVKVSQCYQSCCVGTHTVHTVTHKRTSVSESSSLSPAKSPAQESLTSFCFQPTNIPVKTELTIPSVVLFNEPLKVVFLRKGTGAVDQRILHTT